VGEALEMAPEFAAAHATMAALHLSQQESGEARRELELAERFDPQLAMLPMLWANYFMAEGDNDEALQRARDGVQRQPENVQGRLLLASLYREAGQYAEMRAEARAILERVPESQRDQLRAALLQRLGPTVFDEEEELTEEELEEEEEEVALEGGSEFQLGSGSLLLGGEGGGTSMRPGPSLMGDEMPDPLLPPSDPSTLRLREPGTE
jgi:tetratricopeptide (TPR) repeat protein